MEVDKTTNSTPPQLPLHPPSLSSSLKLPTVLIASGRDFLCAAPAFQINPTNLAMFFFEAALRARDIVNIPPSASRVIGSVCVLLAGLGDVTGYKGLFFQVADGTVGKLARVKSFHHSASSPFLALLPPPLPCLRA